DAAIRRADVKTLAIPAIAAQFNNQSAIRRRATHCATNSLEHDATVQRAEIDATVDIGNRDTAVLSLDGKIRATRHEHFVTDAPVIISAIVRTTREDLRTTGFDPYLSGQQFRFFRSRRTGLHARAYQHLTLIPTLYRDASVLATIDGDWTATRRERLLSDFAVTDQPVVVPTVLVAR